MCPAVSGVGALGVPDVVLVHVLPAVVVPASVPAHLAVTHQRVTWQVGRAFIPLVGVTNVLTVNIEVLESVEHRLHQTVGEADQFIIPEF